MNKTYTRSFLLIFFMMNFILSAWFIDTWLTPNPVSRAIPVLTMVEDGTLKMDQYADISLDKSKVGDHYYSDKAPLPSFVVVPFYAVLHSAGIKGLPMSGPNGQAVPEVNKKLALINLLGGLLCGSLAFALIMLLTLLAIPASKSWLSAPVMIMLAFYGSFLFVFSGTYFNHLFAALFFLVSYIFLKKQKYFLSGLALGLSFLSEYTIGLALPVWLILIYMREKSIRKPVMFASGMIPFIFLIMIYNYMLAGNPFKMMNAYHAVEAFSELKTAYGFRFPSIESVWGLSFSFYMGLFIFTPVLFTFIIAKIKNLRTEKPADLFNPGYSAWFVLGYFLLIASFFTWWGGWSYGPRYLTVIAVLLVYEGLIYLSGQKFSNVAFILFTAFGVFSAWMAKSTVVYLVPDKLASDNGQVPYDNPIFQQIIPEFGKGNLNPGNLLTFITSASPGLASFLWLFLFLAAVAGFQWWYKKTDGIRKKQNVITKTARISK